MGARFGTECYPDAMAAAAVECAGTSGITSAGHLRCASVGGTTLQPHLSLILTPPAGDVVTFQTSALVYRECDPFEPYADLSQLSGLALMALLSIWLVKRFVLKLVMPQ
ncbi:hypothetical protein BURK2_01409 [Burkholderiales bacterium]|nr:hypothetical protein BURK2_01409 [Burkholderiales bacterium]